jgi:hypothetical protein
MDTSILNFDSKMTKAQRETTAKFLDRPMSRNFYYEKDGTVTGIYGKSYDKTYFTIEGNGDVYCYGK